MSVARESRVSFRFYREQRLVVRKRGGRKRALGTRAPMTIPQEANQRWSLDFVSDALGDGRCFRDLAIVDDFARELDAVIVRRGKPHLVVSDNGTVLTSTAASCRQISCLGASDA